MDRKTILEYLQEVRIAIKTLIYCYERASSHNEPTCAGVVLRRFQLLERDLLGFLELYPEQVGIREASPNGEPLSSPQQAEGYPAEGQ